LECSAKSGEGIIELFAKAADLMNARGAATGRRFADSSEVKGETTQCCG
jgi:hypothetical protein